MMRVMRMPRRHGLCRHGAEPGAPTTLSLSALFVVV